MSKLKLDLHEIFSAGQKIDRALTDIMQEAEDKNALKVLEVGLEYVIDDEMEANFMEQLSLSYKGLGQNKIATSYYKKAVDLRKE